MTPSSINNSGGLLQQSEGRSPPELSGGGGGGGYVVEGSKGLKKGPWTAAEDQILMDYVRKHGEGNWNAVQRNSGLNRCGKSCRLRWANHLRPNLKKGAFCPEEERLILELHAKYGNKWARMASQLPGRTDNEIKNYWNTRVKRRQRQGLPLYPHDIKQSQQSHSDSLTPATTTIQNPFQSTTNFSFQIQSAIQAHHMHSLSPTPPSLSPLSSPHHPKSTTLTSLAPFDPTNPTTTSSFSSFTFPRPAPILGAPLRYKRCHDSVGFSPPISPTPQRSSSILRTTSMPDFASYQLTSTNSMPDIASSQLTSTNSMPDIASFQFPRTLNSSLPPLPLPRTQLEYSESFLPSTGLVYSVKSELPSSQVSQTQSEVTIDSKVSSAPAVAVAASKTHSSNGLLEDLLLQEAEVLACGGGNHSKRANGLLSSFEEKHVLDNYGQWLQSTSSMEGSLLEAKPIQDDHISSMPEDLSKLFSFIPSTELVFDWYSDSGELSNSGVTDASLDFDMQQHSASLFPVAATADHGRASSSWDNLPGIC